MMLNRCVEKYNPFGNVGWSLMGTKTRTFIGKESDAESNLGDFGARKYDARIGRFTSVDALWAIQPEHTPYHYSFNSPINYSDPSGLFPLIDNRVGEINMGSSSNSSEGDVGGVCSACGRVHDERGGCIPKGSSGGELPPPNTPSKTPSKPLPPLGNPFSFGNLPFSYGGSQPSSTPSSGKGGGGGGGGNTGSGSDFIPPGSGMPSGSTPTTQPYESLEQNQAVNAELGMSDGGKGGSKEQETGVSLIADARARITITVRFFIGSTQWKTSSSITLEGGCVVPSLQSKCNIFVYQMLQMSGVPPNLPNSPSPSTLWNLLGVNCLPPTASQWADEDFDIPGWQIMPVGTQAEPGDVIAVGRSDGTGHVGIIVESFGVISTISHTTVSEKVVKNDWGFRPNHSDTPNVRLRRWVGIGNTRYYEILYIDFEYLAY